MVNPIQQSDNTVLDFTTITQMITTLNSQQKDIDTIKANLGISSTGHGTKVISGQTLIDNSTGKSITISYQDGSNAITFTQAPVVVACINYNSSNPLYCYVKQARVSDFDVGLNIAVPAGTGHIFWVAVGPI